MAQVVPAWKSIAEMQLKGLFDGSSGNLAYLTDLIANGQLIAGAAPGGGSPSAVVTSETQSSLEQGIAKALFASAIPTLWNLAGTYAFVLDTGMACGASGADGGYVQDIGATGGCYNGNQYYVVYPSGSSRNCVDGELGASCSDNSFSTPPGLSTLDGTRFGGVTLDDLIAGSLKTYAQNGNQNGGAATDPTNDGSVDDLINVDVTTPGFIRLPVCSGFVAFTAWDDAAITSTTANYPCVIKPSPNDCGDSTFIDQTSDGSPSVSDCQGIINNIQGTQGSWEVENAVETQHQIVQYGSCKFGVQGTSVNGNVDFHVGAQDIVDIITAAIQQYGGSGKVGAEGDTSCQGDVSNVPVHWGLY